MAQLVLGIKEIQTVQSLVASTSLFKSICRPSVVHIVFSNSLVGPAVFGQNPSLLTLLMGGSLLFLYHENTTYIFAKVSVRLNLGRSSVGRVGRTGMDTRKKRKGFYVAAVVRVRVRPLVLVIVSSVAAGMASWEWEGSGNRFFTYSILETLVGSHAHI